MALGTCTCGHGAGLHGRKQDGQELCAGDTQGLTIHFGCRCTGYIDREAVVPWKSASKVVVVLVPISSLALHDTSTIAALVGRDLMLNADEVYAQHTEGGYYRVVKHPEVELVGKDMPTVDQSRRELQDLRRKLIATPDYRKA